MKWTETVLVARRQSDGAFFLPPDPWTMEAGWWVDEPSKECAVDPPRFSGAERFVETPFSEVDFVKLTITYEVDDDRI